MSDRLSGLLLGLALAWWFAVTAQGPEPLSFAVGPFPTVERCEAARITIVKSLVEGSRTTTCREATPLQKKNKETKS